MANRVIVFSEEDFKRRIHTVRGLQVMLDSDLAEFYGVETKVLNQAVKRNVDRFPNNFRFQLTEHEDKNLRSQFVTLEIGRGKHHKYLPYVFTEQGVAMLSAVLRSEAAVKMSVQIINAFVSMRRFIVNNAAIFQRLDTIEQKQLVVDTNLKKIFIAMENKEIKPSQGIFFDGQIFDAYVFVSDLVKSAKKSIVLLDNYIDETVLTLFSKRQKNCRATLYTNKISNKLKLDLAKHNKQYSAIEIKEFKDSHDRFIRLVAK